MDALPLPLNIKKRHSTIGPQDPALHNILAASRDQEPYQPQGQLHPQPGNAIKRKSIARVPVRTQQSPTPPHVPASLSVSPPPALDPPAQPQSLYHKLYSYLPSVKGPVVDNTAYQVDNLPSADQSCAEEASTTVCCHCHSGIGYNTPYHTCLFCRVDICATCNTSHKHPSSHDKVTVQFRDIRTFASDERFAKLCVQCNKQFHCRIDCTECGDYSICDACFDAQQGIRAIAHEHTNFRRVREPERNVPVHSPRTKAGYGLSDEYGGIWSHCADCNKGLGAAESAYMCRHCFFKFDHTRSLCVDCRGNACDTHGGDNATISLQLLPAETDDPSKPMFSCLVCARGFSTLKSICAADHEHTSFALSVTDAKLESFINQGYRLYPRKELRMVELPELSKNDSLCSRCLNSKPIRFANARLFFADGVAFNVDSCQFCLNCRRFVYCPDCLSVASEYHHCGTASFVSPADRTLATLGQASPCTAKKAPDGRIWYQMQGTGLWTFSEPSGLIVSLVKAIDLPETSPWESTPLEDGTQLWRHKQTGALTLRHPGNEGKTGLPPGWDFHCTHTGKVLFIHTATQTATFAHPGAVNSSGQGTPPGTSSNGATMTPAYEHRGSLDTGLDLMKTMSATGIPSQSAQARPPIYPTSSSVSLPTSLPAGGHSSSGRRLSSLNLSLAPHFPTKPIQFTFPSSLKAACNAFPTINSTHASAAWSSIKKAGHSDSHKNAWRVMNVHVKSSVHGTSHSLADVDNFSSHDLSAYAAASAAGNVGSSSSLASSFASSVQVQPPPVQPASAPVIQPTSESYQATSPPQSYSGVSPSHNYQATSPPQIYQVATPPQIYPAISSPQSYPAVSPPQNYPPASQTQYSPGQTYNAASLPQSYHTAPQTHSYISTAAPQLYLGQTHTYAPVPIPGVPGSSARNGIPTLTVAHPSTEHPNYAPPIRQDTFDDDASVYGDMNDITSPSGFTRMNSTRFQAVLPTQKEEDLFSTHAGLRIGLQNNTVSGHYSSGMGRNSANYLYGPTSTADTASLMSTHSHGSVSSQTSGAPSMMSYMPEMGNPFAAEQKHEASVKVEEVPLHANEPWK